MAVLTRLLAIVATAASPALAQGDVVPAQAEPEQHESATQVFPIHLHLVNTEDGAVVSDDWIEAQVANANRVFSDAGVRFAIHEKSDLDPRHADLVTRRDRHRLGAYLGGNAVHWFVVRSLADVDEPGRIRRGVHWRPRGFGAGKHFVVVSSIAGPEVLAHELGHFFGNRIHPRDAVGNIMSYEKGPGLGAFDEAQITRVQRSAQRFLETGELISLDTDCAEAAPRDTNATEEAPDRCSDDEPSSE